MDVINLAIFSKDSDYSFALSEALSALKSNFIIEVYSDDKELLKASSFDLLIYDCANDEINENYIGDARVIRLTGSRSEIIKCHETKNLVLYKYSGVKEFVSDIILYYSILTGKKNFIQSDIMSKIITFCGCSGGAGKTVVAFAAGQALRRYYSKSVLYISMEEIESTLLYINDRGEGPGICEYIYYLFKNGYNKPSCDAFTLNDKFGICAFKPDKGGNRLRELDVEHLDLFFKEVSEGGAYDYILVDMGECFSDEMKFVLNISNKTAIVLAPGWENDERQRRFMKYLRFSMGGIGDEALVYVVNKVAEREESDAPDNIIYVDFDKDSITNTGEIYEISIDQDLGAGIKELAKRIL